MLETRVQSLDQEDPLEKKCQPTPVFLHGEFHGQDAWWVAVHGHDWTRTLCYRLSSNIFRKQWQPTPVLLPGKSHGRRSLVGCSPWGRTELDTTERLHFHFLFSCIGEGNGNTLQCSCLQNPRDREPGGLLSMGSHRVGHGWSDLAAAAVLPVI